MPKFSYILKILLMIFEIFKKFLIYFKFSKLLKLLRFIYVPPINGHSPIMCSTLKINQKTKNYNRPVRDSSGFEPQI